MSKTLVIVESPTKARTITKFLGSDFRVESSLGHVRDLPKSTMGVDIAGGTFTPDYVIPDAKKKRVAELKKLAQNATEILFATDEDREGEAISWHLAELLKIKPDAVKRLVFHEITKEAIAAALARPRALDQRLVDAQQARRVLDRLVGYELSPLLWKKVRYGLSAGRVQSVAVHLVVEREKARAAFCSAAYFDLVATLRADRETFTARLAAYQNKSIPDGQNFDSRTGALLEPERFTLLNQTQAEELAQTLLAAEPWTVTKVEKTPYQTHPYPPFITSTLQQEAHHKLGWGAKLTMRAAQSLYEQGYITYMRTDSVHLSDQAVQAARAAAAEFGTEFVADTIKQFANKSKLAQEAHEAIRPAGSSFRHPADMARAVTADEARLYELIWKRTVATQMKSARLVRLSVEIAVNNAVFAATGKRIEFAGYLRAYVEGADDPEAQLEDQEILLPELAKNQIVTADAVTAAGHQTQPPAHYTEASLIKTLETEGVGRPSTYATILDTITQRHYVVKDGRALIPTFTAMIVDQYLQQYFHTLVDTAFTSKMEDDLDRIAAGEEPWRPYIKQFYQGENDAGFHPAVARATTAKDYPRLELGRDPKTGQTLVVKSGKYGPYLQRGDNGAAETSALPETFPPAELTVAAAVALLAAPTAAPRVIGSDPKTGQPLTLRTGRYGPYLQIGEDEGKTKAKKMSLTYGPKQIPISQTIDANAVTLPQALAVISLPRVLGEIEGAAVTASVGRFGPYVKMGDEFRSLPKNLDLFAITLPEARALLAQEKKGGRRKKAAVIKELGADPAGGKPMQILEGRYGPYVSNGARVFASIPKNIQPETVTLAQALQWIEEKKKKKKLETRN